MSPGSYLRAFLTDPRVASVAPSSERVIRRVIEALDPENGLREARVVAEYGPAEGVITRPILERLPRRAVLLAVERNERFSRVLARLPDERLRVVRGEAEDIEGIFLAQGLPPADAVLSGIPFSAMRPARREALIRATHALLRPGGLFVAYQTSTLIRPLLRRHFRSVATGFELRNLPPVFILAARK